MRQYTGVNDVNNNKIYSDDKIKLIQYSNGKKHLEFYNVKFSKSAYGNNYTWTIGGEPLNEIGKYANETIEIYKR